MGFISNMQDDQYRLDTMGMDDPATSIHPDGLWSGLPTALGHSIVGGAAAVGRTLDAIMGSNPGVPMYGGNWTNPSFEAPTAPGAQPTLATEDIKKLQDWAKVDPRTTGPAAQVAGSMARGLTIMGAGSLLGGPVAGAGLLGATEGYNDFADSTAAGLDQNTALAKAGLTGGAAFAGAFLPMKVSGRLAMGLAGMGLEAEVAGNAALSRALFGSARAAATMSSTIVGRYGTAMAVNTGFGIANRYLTSALLYNAGHVEMADQYKALDAQALASDAVLGLAFGGWGHVEEWMDHRTGTAKGELRPLERPDRATIQEAFDTRRQEMMARGAGGVPTDLHTAGLDAELQDRALLDLLKGREVQVHPEEAAAIVHGSILDPERVQLHEDWMAAQDVVFGDLAQMEPPVRREMPIQPYAVPEVGGLAVQPEALPATGIGPHMEEQLRQLVSRHPGLDVQLPDGSTAKAADLPDLLAVKMEEANRDSRLFDVAVACFLRTVV